MAWFFTTASENVMRVLSDLEPEPEFWCRVGLHKWTRWAVTRDQRQYSTMPDSDRIIDQERSCKTCGLLDVKRRTIQAK